MPLYENFPYTNFHELNLDWLVERVAALEAAFPEGTIGIPKGGTGADNAAQARENLEIIAPNIPMSEGSSTTIDQEFNSVDAEISRLEDNLNSLAGDIKYRIFRVVTDLGLTSGTATLSSCWAAMSIGDILIAPPSEFAAGQVPETSGSLIMVRDAGTSGSLRFYGSRTYEQPFTNNYPSGTWHTLLNETDVIPVSQGGTGASTAAEARQNLGIDFSGTVLSVAGVGADTAGNVPLKLDNLVYNTLSELGMGSGSTLSAVWTALPDNSLLIANAADISDPPVNAGGSLEVYKGTSTVPGFIRFHGKESSTGDYAMYLNAAGDPSGTWKRIATTPFQLPITTLFDFDTQDQNSSILMADGHMCTLYLAFRHRAGFTAEQWVDVYQLPINPNLNGNSIQYSGTFNSQSFSVEVSSTGRIRIYSHGSAFTFFVRVAIPFFY